MFVSRNTSLSALKNASKSISLTLDQKEVEVPLSLSYPKQPSTTSSPLSNT